jgi:hypothetical protein
MVKVAVMATATAMPPVAVSSCAGPATFTFQAALTATAPGSLSYRWVYSSGREGQVRALHFAAAGTQRVSGGSVETRQAAPGWAEVQVVSPVRLISNRASYRLMCTSAGTASPVTATASVHPASSTVTCGTPPPAVTFTGSVTSSTAGKVTYYWAQSDGTDSAAATLEFPVPGTRPVQALTVIPPSGTAHGGAEIVVTSPSAAASPVATYALSCHPGGGNGGGQALALSASASVSPAAQTVACGAGPSPLTFSGTITASQPTTVTYHWLINGGPGPAQTLAFTQAGTLPVAPDTSSPPADPDPSQTSGSIVITSPRDATSNTATSALSCTQPDITVSALTATPADTQTVTCGDTPQPVTVTGAISSDQATRAPYEFTHSDGSPGASGTAAIGSGSSAGVTDVVDPPAITSPTTPWSLTDTLVITTPSGTQEQSHITLSASCRYPAPQITTSSLPSGQYQVPYTASLAASGGNGAYQWSASGLPTGLSLDPGTGTISGSPAEAGTFQVTITVTSAGQSQPMTFTLLIYSPIQ